MITYSRQNPIDMCPTEWSFSSDLNRFYNWLNQPIQSITSIPAQKIKIQYYVYDSEVLKTSITSELKVYNNNGVEISGISYSYFVPSDLEGNLYEGIIELSLISNYNPFYVEITADYGGERTETLRSSCYRIDYNEDIKLIKIEFGNTVSNRLINGILFDYDATFNYYIYANKYDCEIEVIQDEQEQDFKGNITLVDKLHSETDIFEIIDMPKKRFMALVTISENDIIYVNGRKAQINFDKATESRIGIYEIPYINAFMRVTYADDNGLLNVRNIRDSAYLKIDSEGVLKIDSESKLKTV